MGVPERLLVWHYLTVLAEDYEGIRGSKEQGVYAPEHPDVRVLPEHVSAYSGTA